MKKFTIKDFIGKEAKYENSGQQIFGVGSKGVHDYQILLEVRGWGAIQNIKGIKEPEKFQDEFGQWVADAINEKLKREQL